MLKIYQFKFVINLIGERTAHLIKIIEFFFIQLYEYTLIIIIHLSIYKILSGFSAGAATMRFDYDTSADYDSAYGIYMLIGN